MWTSTRLSTTTSQRLFCRYRMSSLRVVRSLCLQLVDDFVDDLVQSSARLARHRNGGKVEARDVRFILTRKFHMALPTHSNAGDVGTGVPGTSSSGSGPPSKKPAVNAHQQRLALIEKTLKKP